MGSGLSSLVEQSIESDGGGSKNLSQTKNDGSNSDARTTSTTHTKMHPNKSSNLDARTIRPAHVENHLTANRCPSFWDWWCVLSMARKKPVGAWLFS
jgi:hypothetical protein